MERLVFTILITLGVTSFLLASCADEKPVANIEPDAKNVEVVRISDEMAKVRDYVPLYAIIAHRGSTYWTPEETEAAWRWAREMGVDYLESDLQLTKDGVLLANHDVNLKRTTDIEEVFGDKIPETRKEFYRSFRNADGSQHFSEADIDAQYQRDVNEFEPFYTMSYYYHELLTLDAGGWFNASNSEQARASFSVDGGVHLYVSALQDQMAYARGQMLKRDERGERVLTYKIKDAYKDMTLEQIYYSEKKTVKCDDTGVAYPYAAKYMDFVEYDFSGAYVDDPQDTGNRPGIYIEFKKPQFNPEDMEVRVYNLLTEYGWNIITKPAGDGQPFYLGGKVNVGNTNGKVIMQTFSADALSRAYDVFGGKIPMCFLLWKTADSTSVKYENPVGYADLIKCGLDRGAHIMGPSIGGEPENYAELNCPWQAYLICRSGMLNHPYTFDTLEQMETYTGYGDTESSGEYDDLLLTSIPATAYTPFSGYKSTLLCLDGLFTNRSDLSLRFMLEHGYRCNANLPNPFHQDVKYDNSQAPTSVPDAVETLRRLGY